MKKTKSPKDRGKFLTIMLVLYGLSILNIIPIIPTSSTTRILEIYSAVPWYQYWFWANSLISVVIFVGLLNWKKYAAYLLFTHFIINLFSVNFILEPYTPRYFNILAASVGLATWIWAIKRKWHFFE